MTQKNLVSIKDLKLLVAYKHSRAGSLSSSVNSNIFLYPSFILAIFLDILTLEYPRHLITQLIAPSFALGLPQNPQRSLRQPYGGGIVVLYHQQLKNPTTSKCI